MDNPTSGLGVVHIVGAGPGAPDLLTVRALDRIRKAQVLVHDRLIGSEVLDLAPAGAERIYVGKSPGDHSMPQSQIHSILIEQARARRYVVRLKGGDPYVFGRGGEEIEALQQAGIAFEVVPGITAANGCAAAVGIPLTHRGLAQSCILLSGHLADSVAELDWRALAQPNLTRVFYMGVERLSHIQQRLTAHGLTPDTPAALIQDGTRRTQAILATELDALVKHAPSYSQRPGLLVIGETVRLSPYYQTARENLAPLTFQCASSEADEPIIEAGS